MSSLIIVLNKDGTYIKYKNYKKFKSKHTGSIAYVIFDISTALKGPVYTVVKDVNFESIDQFIKYSETNCPISVHLDITYDSMDIPSVDAIHIQQDIDINSAERFYSIYPLIQQITLFNAYAAMSLLNTEEINIDDVRLVTNNGIRIKAVNIFEDDSFNRIMTEMSMRTTVDKLIKDRTFLILNDNEWSVEEIIPDTFDYIGIKVGLSETIYLLSYEKCMNFFSIRKIRIDIFERGMPSSFITDADTFPVDIEPYLMSSDTVYTEGVLETCLLLPQLFTLQKAVYQSSNSLMIHVLTTRNNYSLYISSIEASNGLCLFDIIDKLVSM